MSEFEIEDNMPIPALSGHGKYQRKYPLHEMDVGQSFFVPFEGDSRKHLMSLSGVVTRYGKKNGKIFITRTVKGGARVWRVT